MNYESPLTEDEVSIIADLIINGGKPDLSRVSDHDRRRIQRLIDIRNGHPDPYPELDPDYEPDPEPPAPASVPLPGTEKP